MPRTIKTDQNNYLTTILKLIPSEIVGVNIFLQGLISEELYLRLVISIGLIILTPIYLCFAMKVKSKLQLVLSAISAVVWLYSLGSINVPITGGELYNPLYGSVFLALWSLVPPIFMQKTSPK